MKKSIVFKGVYPALITPFKADGSMEKTAETYGVQAALIK